MFELHSFVLLFILYEWTAVVYTCLRVVTKFLQWHCCYSTLFVSRFILGKALFYTWLVFHTGIFHCGTLCICYRVLYKIYAVHRNLTWSIAKDMNDDELICATWMSLLLDVDYWKKWHMRYVATRGIPTRWQFWSTLITTPMPSLKSLNPQLKYWQFITSLLSNFKGGQFLRPLLRVSFTQLRQTWREHKAVNSSAHERSILCFSYLLYSYSNCINSLCATIYSVREDSSCVHLSTCWNNSPTVTLLLQHASFIKYLIY